MAGLKHPAGADGPPATLVIHTTMLPDLAAVKL